MKVTLSPSRWAIFIQTPLCPCSPWGSSSGWGTPERPLLSPQAESDLRWKVQPDTYQRSLVASAGKVSLVPEGLHPGDGLGLASGYILSSFCEWVIAYDIRFKQVFSAWLGREQHLMCDFISSTTYNHTCQFLSSDHPPREDPLPRVRAQGLAAVEEDGQQPYRTLATHHVLCTSLSVGSFSNCSPDFFHGGSKWRIPLVLWGSCKETGRGWFQVDVQPVLPSPPFTLSFPATSGRLVLVLWSQERKLVPYQRSCSHELLVGLWERRAGSRLELGLILLLSEILKERL